MSDRDNLGERHEELDIRFRAPEVVPVTLRLNHDELFRLTDGARAAGMKLSDFIKQVALQSPEVSARAAREH